MNKIRKSSIKDPSIALIPQKQVIEERNKRSLQNLKTIETEQASGNKRIKIGSEPQGSFLTQTDEQRQADFSADFYEDTTFENDNNNKKNRRQGASLDSQGSIKSKNDSVGQGKNNKQVVVKMSSE